MRELQIISQEVKDNVDTVSIDRLKSAFTERTLILVAILAVSPTHAPPSSVPMDNTISLVWDSLISIYTIMSFRDSPKRAT